MEELMKDLDTAYSELEHLNIAPTHPNVLIMADVFGILKNAYEYLATEVAKKKSEEAEKEGAEDVHS